MNAVTPVGARAMTGSVPPTAAPARSRNRCSAGNVAALFAMLCLFARAQFTLRARAFEFFLFARDLGEHQLQPFRQVGHFSFF
jgi:hypothetical protein